MCLGRATLVAVLGLLALRRDNARAIMVIIDVRRYQFCDQFCLL